ncbi:MAG: phosphoribosyl-AMP cyclohydrolase [Candidatus Omnitrophica bacterium]|nr:phosphoribosyl-AMP cyclohydrolase [Candidatus Omnitrophota bacterium]MCM8777273.1 phosphoribosyl-AMP cyclohydrolase [Candidatus Omnitrophota bacterium]
MNNKILTQIKFDEKGLIPVVVQSAKTKEVIMLAYMNEEAFSKTIETGRMHYYSRSRKKLWMKGEESGNFQEVKEMYIDCDNDTLLFIVEQKRGACHTGHYSCFFRKLNDRKDDFIIKGGKVFDPDEVYKK